MGSCAICETTIAQTVGRGNQENDNRVGIELAIIGVDNSVADVASDENISFEKEDFGQPILLVPFTIYAKHDADYYFTARFCMCDAKKNFCMLNKNRSKYKTTRFYHGCSRYVRTNL